MCKLKALKINLKKWNEEVFGNVEKRKKVILDELWLLNVNAEERPFYDAEKVRKDVIASDLENVLLFWKKLETYIKAQGVQPKLETKIQGSLFEGTRIQHFLSLCAVELLVVNGFVSFDSS